MIITMLIYSYYAWLKLKHELMAHSYSSLYDMSVTGLRFFTVYGPKGRPDMAPFLFTDKILRDEEMQVFNNGEMFLDLTYINDIVAGIIDVIDSPATKNESWNPEVPEASTSYCAYRILNIGSDKPTKLMDFVNAIEEAFGKKQK